MLREIVQEMRAEFRELPGIGVTIALAMAVGLGANGAVFNEADGEALRVKASMTETAEELMNRMQMHSCSAQTIPGFTVILAVRQYSVELSVPVRLPFHGRDAESVSESAA